jgi:flagellar hook assembly protein FlgD
VSFIVPRAEHVQMKVHDVTGRLVRTLVDSRLDAGEHRVRWDGRSDRGARSAAGVYFLRLDTSQGSSSRKVILLE